MVKYITISRKKFNEMFNSDNWDGWENFGGFWTKESAIKQMKDYTSGSYGEWALVPPAKKTVNSGGYYNVLFRKTKEFD